MASYNRGCGEGIGAESCSQDRQTEARRIEKVVSSMQARRSGYICSRPCGSPPISVAGSEPSQSPAVSPAPSQVSRKGNAVHFVHQIYGLFGDGKPMSALFQESHRRWSDVAAGMGAQYHLWNADELESLVKQRYPQLWDMYCGVRCPIMRSDIGRIVVIHAYGGLYADLDIYPNRTWYEQSSFTLPRVQMTEKKHGTDTGPRLREGEGGRNSIQAQPLCHP